MGSLDRLRVLVRLAWAFAWTPVWCFVLHPLWRRAARAGDAPWVVSGHRGRMYGDNAAAVEQAARQAGQPILWLCNHDAEAGPRAHGAVVLRRNSWAARRAISRAPVLLYSHGEDDLDISLIFLRGRTGLRVYLGHSLSLLKAGGVSVPGWQAQPAPVRALRRWLLTDCDRLLCASPEEADNFAASYPMHRGKLRLGGGAHLDGWARGAERPPERRIYWFPTFREHAADRARLDAVIREVCTSPRLREWLLANDYELFLGGHINSGGPSKLELSPPFFAAATRDVAADASASELLISDYSGIIFDYLLTERAQVLFAFDLENYLADRELYVDYAGLDFALHPRSASELVDVVCSEAWRDPRWHEAATRHRRRALPPGQAGFARESLLAIQRELSTWSPGAQLSHPVSSQPASISQAPAAPPR